MPANIPTATDAYARLISINHELAEVNSTILRELPDLKKNPELISELIRRCELLLCDLLEVRAANDGRAGQWPESFEGAIGDVGPNGNGSASPA